MKPTKLHLLWAPALVLTGMTITGCGEEVTPVDTNVVDPAPANNPDMTPPRANGTDPAANNGMSNDNDVLGTPGMDNPDMPATTNDPLTTPDMGDGLNNRMDNSGNAIEGTARDATRGLDNIGNDLDRTMDNAGDATNGALENAGEATGDALENTGEAIEGAGEEIKDESMSAAPVPGSASVEAETEPTDMSFDFTGK